MIWMASTIDSGTDLAEFEQEVAKFLDLHLSKKGTSDGRDSASPPTELERLAAAKAWQRQRFDAGLGWIMGPRDYGGRELTLDHLRSYHRLEAAYDTPPLSQLNFGLTIIGSAILGHGRVDTRDKYLPGLYRGELVACQLFSEPAAGSDLAGVTTRAVRDGDGWVINGQKVWTSSGHLADVGECVCRTDMDAPKHRGITIFMVDMHAPGVEVRPIVDASGEVHFNEVFLTDVRIGDEDRIGEVNDGWRTLNTSLMNERAYVGESNEGGANVLTPELLIETLRKLDVLEDPAVRQGLADMVVRFKVAQYLTKHAKQRLDRGETPGPEMSMAKLTFSENQERLVNFAAQALGASVTAEDDEDTDVFAWANNLIRGRSLRIAGGTDEIQRTIIGEKVLGLPRDPSIDNSIPFKNIPRSARSAS
jgi:alkylation response protein AidB-like acyl-CoA dehydrogenase